LVQAFLKKWWVESDFKAPNLPLSLNSSNVRRLNSRYFLTFPKFSYKIKVYLNYYLSHFSDQFECLPDRIPPVFFYGKKVKVGLPGIE
jgi:hypothetical protein